MRIAVFVFALLALAAVADRPQEAVVDIDQYSSAAVVVHTVGGKGFHRHLRAHIPLLPSQEVSTRHQTVDITIGLSLRNTFFLDVAEVEQLWSYHHDAPLSGVSGYSIFSVKLIHPVYTKYPYDIEAPVMKVPYTFNDAKVTFRITYKHTGRGAVGEELVLSLPIHERYERVSVDGSESHVERCLFASSAVGERMGGIVTVSASGGGLSFISKLPLRFAAIEEDSEWSSTTYPSWAGPHSQIKDSFCFRVPLGDLTDLPIFYGLTMALMIAGAGSVFLALRTM